MCHGQIRGKARVDRRSSKYIQYMVFENQRKVSFYDIASEYILTEQKFIKKAKNGQFGDFLKDWSLWTNSVTRLVNFRRTKIDVKCQSSKIKMRHFWCFSNRSYFKIYWKYWKRKKLREKMCYFPLCCVRIGPKSNHQQSLSPIFFSNGQETPMMTRFSFLSDGKFSRFSKSLFSQKAPIFL